VSHLLQRADLNRARNCSARGAATPIRPRRRHVRLTADRVRPSTARRTDAQTTRNHVRVQDLFRSLCIGSDRRSKPDRRSVFERLSPCNRFFSSDRVSTPLRRSLPERLSVPVRLSSSLIDASPAVLQDTLRPNRLARISREQPGTGDAKIAPKCLRFMEGPRGRRTKPGKGPRASG
jgi:hypothetical protein